MAVYGAGKFGQMALELLDHVGVTPDCVVDVRAADFRELPYWAGRKLVTPDELTRDQRAALTLGVSIATLPFESLAQQLAPQGWKEITPFYDIAEAYRAVYPLSNGWVWDRVDEMDLDFLDRVLARWDDDVSRAHHLQFLAWHRLREDWTFDDAPVNQGDRYFIPEVLAVLDRCPRFLDVGAHQGEVAQRYLAQCGKATQLWLVEPDAKNAARIRNWLATLPARQAQMVALLTDAVADRPARQPFFSGIGYASQLTSVGGELRDVTTLDALNLNPSYIKLHLEGAELNALKGAVQTLRRHHPLVAMTTYHNTLGVWEAPYWLMQELQTHAAGYQFKFRTHSWVGTGGVMYAIPARDVLAGDPLFQEPRT